MATRAAWADWWGWQQRAENAGPTAFLSAAFCQRMSAIEVGSALELIDPTTVLLLRLEAAYEQYQREIAAAEPADQPPIALSILGQLGG